jgi:hypothetical protein
LHIDKQIDDMLNRRVDIDLIPLLLLHEIGGFGQSDRVICNQECAGLALLVEAAVADPAECQALGSSPNGGNVDGETTKTVSVEDKTFFVVKATAESLVLLGDYLKIVINLELVVTDVMSRIIEFLKVC